MKPLHIALIVLAAIGLATVISLYGNTTQYVSFYEAAQLSEEHPYKEYHVVCQLDKSKPLEYNAQEDANKLVFYAIDSLGNASRVIYGKPKPQDMERSEKLVLIGKHRAGDFYATDILSKCPSKYEDAPVQVGQVQ
ncbi:MAG: cytochrome c maturation protein CcmE [Bacteroidetes bacterium]|nr:cytochrome c maturation protein CcmE [Bacteroidota bacterium]MDA0943325.1 cytochrome c maturation protein CcmE [Bacteroidota bacterium]MDA1111061.1 cytochrome c maturation protein CcmE [Bacteroidota bacterium]